MRRHRKPHRYVIRTGIPAPAWRIFNLAYAARQFADSAAIKRLLNKTNEILAEFQRDRLDAGAPFYRHDTTPEQRQDRRRQYLQHKALEGI